MPAVLTGSIRRRLVLKELQVGVAAGDDDTGDGRLRLLNSLLHSFLERQSILESGAILGNLGPFDSTPVGTIGKVCVSKASNNNELVVRQVIRQLGHETAPFHRPPFTAEGCPG